MTINNKVYITTFVLVLDYQIIKKLLNKNQFQVNHASHLNDLLGPNFTASYNSCKKEREGGNNKFPSQLFFHAFSCPPSLPKRETQKHSALQTIFTEI